MIATSLGPRLFAASLVLVGVLACSSKESQEPPSLPSAGRAGATGQGGIGGALLPVGGTGGSGAMAGVDLSFGGAKPACQRKTCAELGVGCGKVVDECNRTGPPIDCAAEGLTCGAQEVCIGGGDQPAKCETSFGPCAVCDAIPDCKAMGTPTVLKGRVVTPGRTDGDTANQVGVPNAVVYILRSTDVTEIPPITSGIPMGGTSCDRCDTLDLGPTLVGAITDATGRFTLNEYIPVGVEFLLVVKVGKFRRVVKHTLPAAAACTTTELPATLPDNPTRLPRSMTDGLAVNIPTIAVSTGEVDAMECVLEKMGLEHKLFGNPVATITAETPRIHLYRGLSGTGIGGPGGPPGGGDGGAGGMDEEERGGASIDPMTPTDDKLYESLPTLQKYDFVIADCEGSGYDSAGEERQKWGANVREYVNRGGRLFSSHLSYTWLDGNGEAPYDAANAIGTGLDPASQWSTSLDSMTPDGIGAVALNRPLASPRVQNFSDWLTAEGVITPQMNTFEIYQPRSQATGIGESSEEFVYLQNRSMRTQQFSFNTPYGAPEDAVCGRVAYSGFHVAATMGTGAGNISPFKDIQFPAHCMGGLSAQEKVLLYMIFDLGACIGEIPPPPKCEPQTCESTMTECGYISDGCGGVEDCGPCPVPIPR